ncbi:hypothetical protein J3R82DRAFT_5078 [Butyriboletus roseoflavus]|nr:hypothetical protein J3R82DRAFT_5078 [Butyriboletus roseoflavus]
MSIMTLHFQDERNSESGGNAGLMDPYLLQYGLLNLVSIVLAEVARLLIHVLCSLRSSKYLHNLVHLIKSWLSEGFNAVCFGRSSWTQS